MSRGLGKSQVRVLAYLKTRPDENVFLQEVCTVLPDLSTDTIKSALRRLCENGTVLRTAGQYPQGYRYVTPDGL